MFSGIIEEIGTIASFNQYANLTLWDGSIGAGVVIVVECQIVLEDAYIGSSIAVNGVCLTVTQIARDAGSTGSGKFTANIAPETIRRTNLGQLRAGDLVNLERPLKASDRISGHNVQGHVDGVAEILKFENEGDSLWVWLKPRDKDSMQYLVEKGYIAIDGTSLTVCHVDRSAGCFNVMLISHTQSAIALPKKRIGDLVNLEYDVLAKYSQIQQTKNNTSPSPPTQPSLGTNPDAEMTAIVAQTKSNHGTLLSLPCPNKIEAKAIRVGVVSTCWHSGLIDLMRGKCLERLREMGVAEHNIVHVVAPGSFEIPYLAKRMIEQANVDVVITIGILLKGATIHMEVLADATTKSLLDLQLSLGVPIVFGVLTVLAIEQAVERAKSDLPKTWADTALCMAMNKQELRLAKL
eukprot:c16220_g1_i2.p1 GENE.c16220_g1_i2~~c16220_g1_i2.p1  ORF type:complete len:442 (-),score=133.96 c16220_g1_i2:443-1663(-)